MFLYDVKSVVFVLQFSGCPDELPVYSVDLSGSGKGVLTGPPVSLENLDKAGKQIMARIEVQVKAEVDT